VRFLTKIEAQVNPIKFDKSYGGMVEDKALLKLIPKTDSLRNYVFDDGKTLGGVIARSNGKPIGFSTYHSTVIEIGPPSSELYAIVQISVDSKYQGQGLGENLLKQTLTMAKGEGYKYFIGYTNHSPGFKRLASKYKIIDIDDASSRIGWDQIQDNVPLREALKNTKNGE